MNILGMIRGKDDLISMFAEFVMQQIHKCILLRKFFYHPYAIRLPINFYQSVKTGA